MIGKTTRLLMIGAVACMLVAGPAAAKTVNGVIFDEAPGPYPQGPVLLEDNDKTYIMDVNQNGLLDNGDVLRGMFEVQSIRGPGSGGTPIGFATNNELTGIYDIQVAFTWAPGAPGNPNPADFTWAFGPDLGFGGYPGDPAGIIPGAMVAMFDDSAQDYQDDMAVAGNEENLIGTAGDRVIGPGPGGGAASATALLWAQFGMVGNAAEVWWTKAPTNVIAAVSAGPAEGTLAGPSATGGLQLSLIPSGGLADQILWPNPSGVELDGSLGIFGKDTDSGTPGVQPAFTNFDVSSDNDLTITVVPLPPAVFGGLGLFGFGLIMRIRRRFF